MDYDNLTYAEAKALIKTAEGEDWLSMLGGKAQELYGSAKDAVGGLGASLQNSDLGKWVQQSYAKNPEAWQLGGSMLGGAGLGALSSAWQPKNRRHPLSRAVTGGLLGGLGYIGGKTFLGANERADELADEAHSADVEKRLKKIEDVRKQTPSESLGTALGGGDDAAAGALHTPALGQDTVIAKKLLGLDPVGAITGEDTLGEGTGTNITPPLIGAGAGAATYAGLRRYGPTGGGTFGNVGGSSILGGSNPHRVYNELMSPQGGLDRTERNELRNARNSAARAEQGRGRKPRPGTFGASRTPFRNPAEAAAAGELQRINQMQYNNTRGLAGEAAPAHSRPSLGQRARGFMRRHVPGMKPARPIMRGDAGMPISRQGLRSVVNQPGSNWQGALAGRDGAAQRAKGGKGLPALAALIVALLADQGTRYAQDQVGGLPADRLQQYLAGQTNALK